MLHTSWVMIAVTQPGPYGYRLSGATICMDSQCKWPPGGAAMYGVRLIPRRLGPFVRFAYGKADEVLTFGGTVVRYPTYKGTHNQDAIHGWSN